MTNVLVVNRAEAEQMRMKAAAYAQYGDAAVMSLVLEALPQVTSKNWIVIFDLYPSISRLLQK